MAEWQIKPLSKKSASGRDISAGSVVVCAVFVDELGNLDRMDFLKDEFDPSKVSGKILGRWERIVSDKPDEDEKVALRMRLAGSEDFFLSLFDADSGVVCQEADVVKQMLALLLERKRILRPQGRAVAGVQKYLHPSSGRVFNVPQKDADESLIIKIQSQIDAIII